ncbi:MAG: O-antigen ligase family protein [bacterium]
METIYKDLRLSAISFYDLLLKYLIPLIYLSVTVAFYLRTYDSAQVKITLMQILGAIAAAIWLLKIIEENQNPFKKNNIFTVPLIIYLALGYLSFAHSSFPGTTLDEFVRRNFYILFALIVIKEFDSGEKIRRLIIWILVAAFISNFYAIIQYLDYHYFPKVPGMGLDPFIWRGAFGPRIFSTHGNPNFFGNFLVIVAPIIMSLILKTMKKNPFPYIVLFLMTVFSLYHTSSKGAFLGFAAGIFIFSALTIIYLPIGKIKLVRRVFIVFTGLVLIVSVFFVAKISLQRLDSLRFRVFTWLSTWEMIETHPVLGTGLGTFKTTYPAYRRPEIFHIEGKHNTETDHPENEFLEILYDDGIVGFSLFMWIVILFTVTGLKSLKSFSSMVTQKVNKFGKKIEVLEEPRAYYMLGILSAFLAMLFHNLVDVSLRFVSSGIFLWLLIGLIGSLTVNNPMPEKSPKPEPVTPENALFPLSARWFQRVVQVMVVVVAAYLVHIFYGYFSADIHHNRGIFYSKQAKWDEALMHYREVNRLNPNYIMAHYFMGNVYNDRWQEGDWDRALKKYNDVKELAPNYVQMHHQVGNLYTKLAEQYFRKAQDLRDEGKEAEAGKFEEMGTENYKLSLVSYEKYRKLDPVFPQNFYRMAMIYMKFGQQDDAEKIYEASLEHNPGNSESYFHLGNLRYMRGKDANEKGDNEKYVAKLKEAEEAYINALKYSPDNLQAMKNLTVIYRETGRNDEASKMWNRIASLYPDDEDVKRILQKK